MFADIIFYTFIITLLLSGLFALFFSRANADLNKRLEKELAELSKKAKSKRRDSLVELIEGIHLVYKSPEIAEETKRKELLRQLSNQFFDQIRL